MLAVVCGSEPTLPEGRINDLPHQPGRAGSAKGVPPISIFPIDFICEAADYKFTHTRSRRDGYHLFISEAPNVPVGVRGHRDGGLLILLNGRSLASTGTGRRHCLTSTARHVCSNRAADWPAPPGKLRQSLPSRAAEHVKTRQVFAPVEVLRRYSLPLITQEDGIVYIGSPVGGF